MIWTFSSAQFKLNNFGFIIVKPTVHFTQINSMVEFSLYLALMIHKRLQNFWQLIINDDGQNGHYAIHKFMYFYKDNQSMQSFPQEVEIFYLKNS